MHDKVPFEVGEKAVVSLGKDGGYSPKIHDGSTVEVVGYDLIHYGRTNNFGRAPGVYENPSWVKIRCIQTGIEGYEYASRLVAVEKKSRSSRRDRKRLGDLPETPFYEGDIVRMLSRPDDPGCQRMVVDRIDYHQLDKKAANGSPYPAYQVSMSDGGYTYASAGDLELIERGDVWKYFHGEPIEFADLRAEGDFFQSLGHTEEVRNPANQLYSWTLLEVLRAIQDGSVDGFRMSGGLYGSRPSIDAMIFKDRNLGRRIAKQTLEGFPEEVATINS